MRRCTFTPPTQHSPAPWSMRQAVAFALALTCLALALTAALMLATAAVAA